MNSQPASALQKASFVLLVFIAGALAYLIVRGHLESKRRAADAEAATANASAEAPMPHSTSNPTERSSFAPLRPRAETNVVRIVTGRAGRVIPSPMNTAPSLASQTTQEAGAAVPVPDLNPPAPPVPVAFTRGAAEVSTVSSIVGRVTLRGTPPPEKIVKLDAFCSSAHLAQMTTRHYLVGERGGLANAFVYVKSGLKPQRTPQASIPLLDNINCEFQPYVLGVRAGQPFAIRNSDSTLHNMHGLPRVPGNTEFNLGFPTKGMTQQRTFQKPEIFVQIKCEVHPWMFAFIGVVDHPWFAVTDANGNFAIPAGLPHGRCTIAAAHPKAGETTQEIIVDEGVPATMSFTLDVPKTLAQSATR